MGTSIVLIKLNTKNEVLKSKENMKWTRNHKDTKIKRIEITRRVHKLNINKIDIRVWIVTFGWSSIYTRYLLLLVCRVLFGCAVHNLWILIPLTRAFNSYYYILIFLYYNILLWINILLLSFGNFYDFWSLEKKEIFMVMYFFLPFISPYITSLKWIFSL